MLRKKINKDSIIEVEIEKLNGSNASRIYLGFKLDDLDESDLNELLIPVLRQNTSVRYLYFDDYIFAVKVWQNKKNQKLMLEFAKEVPVKYRQIRFIILRNNFYEILTKPLKPPCISSSLGKFYFIFTRTSTKSPAKSFKFKIIPQYVFFATVRDTRKKIVTKADLFWQVFYKSKNRLVEQTALTMQLSPEEEATLMDFLCKQRRNLTMMWQYVPNFFSDIGTCLNDKKHGEIQSIFKNQIVRLNLMRLPSVALPENVIIAQPVISAKYYPSKSIVQDVVIKQRGSLLGDAAVNEMHIIQQLLHPNIIKLLGYCKIADDIAMIMPHMKKKSLDFFIRTEGKGIKDKTKLNLARQIISAVSYLHEYDVLHRDLKAANILIDVRDKKLIAILCDFGSAACRCEDVNQRYYSTPEYLAPEILKEWGQAGVMIIYRKSAEIFSLGVLLWEIFATQIFVDYIEPKRAKFQKKLEGDMFSQRWDLMRNIVKNEKNGYLPKLVDNNLFCKAIAACWHFNPEKRPSTTDLFENYFNQNDQGDISKVDIVIVPIKPVKDSIDKWFNHKKVIRNLDEFLSISKKIQEKIMQGGSALDYDVLESNIKNYAFSAKNFIDALVKKNIRWIVLLYILHESLWTIFAAQDSKLIDYAVALLLNDSPKSILRQSYLFNFDMIKESSQLAALIGFLLMFRLAPTMDNNFCGEGFTKSQITNEVLSYNLACQWYKIIFAFSKEFSGKLSSSSTSSTNVGFFEEIKQLTEIDIHSKNDPFASWI